MFQRTLNKLSVLNSVVFMIIFVIFGAILYGFVSYRLLDKVDDAMREKINAFKVLAGRPALGQGRVRTLPDPRIFLVLRGTNGEIINLYPNRNEEVDVFSELASQVELGEKKTREHENHTYRIISVPAYYEEKRLPAERGGIMIQDIIAVSIVDSEKALLKNLLLIIISGLVIGMIIIIIAGYYLAKRAMIPIREAWEKQQDFVADASHELRTPLTVIKSNAELMLRHPEHTVEEESFRVTNIIREVRRLTKLVSGLLTLARSDANQAELQLVPVSLNEIVSTVIEQFQPFTEMKGIRLIVDMEEQLELQADKERLHQLLVILLDNAVKYTDAEGEIKLSCKRQDGNIIITVEDTGCGIAPEDLPRVFDRFFRGDKARSNETGGTGLGMAIAKWIIEKHGGKIEVKSQLDVGTKFQIVLPGRKR